jgi:hypothetical protein
MSGPADTKQLPLAEPAAAALAALVGLAEAYGYGGFAVAFSAEESKAAPTVNHTALLPRTEIAGRLSPNGQTLLNRLAAAWAGHYLPDLLPVGWQHRPGSGQGRAELRPGGRVVLNLGRCEWQWSQHELCLDAPTPPKTPAPPA